MSEYRPIQSSFGTLWLHHCAALDHGPEWTRRERLIVDAGARNSRLTFGGKSFPFHAHLFRERDGLLHISAKGRALYPADLLAEIEQIVNRFCAALR